MFYHLVALIKGVFKWLLQFCVCHFIWAWVSFLMSQLTELEFKLIDVYKCVLLLYEFLNLQLLSYIHLLDFTVLCRSYKLFLKLLELTLDALLDGYLIFMLILIDLYDLSFFIFTYQGFDFIFYLIYFRNNTGLISHDFAV